MHKAEPSNEFKAICRSCREDIRQVSGGRGVVWVHSDGYVVGKGPACEHDPYDIEADNSLHWREDSRGVEYRVECGCPCLACQRY